MSSKLVYSVVTPVRDEAESLPRVAKCMAAQTVLPLKWVIVDNGSNDETVTVGRALAREHEWVEFMSIPGSDVPTRGAPIVRAFNAGLERVGCVNDIVVKLDADVSFDEQHFEHLLAEFKADEKLGLAGGICLEEKNGSWRPTFATRDHVRGAERAYRRACLADVTPLEERMGWDGVDEVKAAVAGWRTKSFRQLPLRHHRSLGERENSVDKWVRQGDMAHYMWYRPSYLVFRALYRALEEPSALAMIWGYAAAAFRSSPRLQDPRAKDWLRREQKLRRLRTRAREALGRA